MLPYILSLPALNVSKGRRAGYAHQACADTSGCLGHALYYDS